jgi:tRNA-2-methylthio-N6-dimethylallyladenosine synthase
MKYHIWTEGCQMNTADSRRVASALEVLGYNPTNNPQDADVIVLNTCVVRQSAEDKAIGRLSSLRPLKTKNPNLVINVMGCLVGVHGNAQLQARFPWVDVVSPPSDPQPLIQFLNSRIAKELSDAKQKTVNDILDGNFILPQEDQDKLVSAYIPIVYGCSHACTYCIIPAKRGREHSRSYNEILEEARGLVRQGVREITLLGQIVDRYGLDLPDDYTLSTLLRGLHQVKELKRIRFLTSHPNWMTDELMDAVLELPKVCPHIEVPIQAGDDEVLSAMHRGYTNEAYRELIAKLRERIPGVSIATDIIVGFPGETEAQFAKTYELLDDLRMDVAHLARYSPRPGTYAARKLTDDIPNEEKLRRFRLLEELQKQISTEINARLLEKTVSVLFEDTAKGRWRGRTPTNKLVFVECQEDHHGQERWVRVTWTGPWSMIGVLAD